MPRGAGSQDRRYCVHNRNQPNPDECRWYVSAGRIIIAHSCGHIVAMRTMFWHESHAHVFALLREVHKYCPNLFAFGYDDACHFAPWVRSRYRQSADLLARHLAVSLDYFVDRFHFCGHTDPTCHTLYNPHDRAYLAGANTSTTEQQWHWLNRYGHIERHMKSTRADVLLLRMAMLRNTVR